MSSHNEAPDPLGSVYTTNLPTLLAECGISLLITTYQAGKLVVVRTEGESINTHFREFARPMGMAVSGHRIAFGTALEVHEYYNVPAVIRKLERPERFDACYLPRNVHTTGDIDIHEMAWGNGGELWCANTRFSTLCTIDSEHSFVPRWRPKFVSKLSPEDRCHLNGLGMVDGEPRYVSALGSSDQEQGWRDNKSDGGVVIDLSSNEIIAQGLCMPHSPRWYGDRIWILESGTGSLSTIDAATGKTHTMQKLPGFTRGLDFAGPLAFVGLSQVRESATFSGLPVTEHTDERCCGVWVVNVSTGNTVAFLRFEDAVQESFAVQVVPFRFPEIVEPNDTLISATYTLPDEALKDV